MEPLSHYWGHLHLQSHPACPQRCSCPLWGQCASCHTTSCPSRHTGTQLRPMSLLAGDAAHRAAGARVLHFALGHALRMLPEPAASCQHERSQPVPSCRTRPACPAAGSLPGCQGPCPAAGSLLGLWPEMGKEIRKEDPGFRPPPLSGLRAVLCVCASLFSSPWLMKYLGSLSCSPVSAFRFDFPDLSWGFGGGGQFCLAFPARGGSSRDPTTGALPPTPAWLLCRIISFPCGLSCRAPSVMCRGGSWITSQSPCPYQNTPLCPVSPWGIFVGQGVAVLSPGAPGAGRSGAECPRGGSPGAPHTSVPAHAPQP